jgi:poly(A) polymerase
MCRWPALVVALCLLLLATAARAADFQQSYIAGQADAAGRFMGGTEMRLLVAHGGRLYAGNGYWEDQPGPEGAQGAWRVDHQFDERKGNGRPRDLAVGALFEANFATDARGAPLPRPVSLLIASNWDLTGANRVFTRDDTTGSWTTTTLAQNQFDPNFLPQIRSFGSHRDRVTGVDLVFAGEDPRGIFSGTYDPSVTGWIRWSAAPELDLSLVPAEGISGRNGYLRVPSFAEANGRLYATVGQHVYERVDGAAPQWRLLYTNQRPGHSETGLRGLTGVPGPGGDVLLAAIEGNISRVVRIDPRGGSETTELDVDDFLGRSWGMRPNYTIVAYNDMAKIGGSVLMGVMAFIPRTVPVAAGHTLVDVGYGQVESGGWYLVRDSGGRYMLHRVTTDSARPLVAVRTIAASPFPGDSAVYFAGYDANKAPVHNTAWIVRASLATALGSVR